MAKPRLKRCGACGEIIRPGGPTKFDVRIPDTIFHDPCFWGTCLARGWSFYQARGGPPPLGLLVPCPVCDRMIDTGSDPVWYEAEGDGAYRAYHVGCSPSRLGD